MKQKEAGQGLVEYALLLVLVAVVVIAKFLSPHQDNNPFGVILGPSVSNCFLPISPELVFDDSDMYFYSVHEVSMGVTEESLLINLDGEICAELVDSWSVVSSSNGTVENFNNGMFIYRRDNVDSQADGSFDYNININNVLGEGITLPYRVIIIVGEPDFIESATASMRLQEGTSSQEFNYVWEATDNLTVAEVEQIENLAEGFGLTLEATTESLDVFMDYAQNINNSTLFETITQINEVITDENWDSLSDLMEILVPQLTDAPMDVYVEMNMKMAPILIKSCVVVSNGMVSSEIMTDAIEEVEGLPDSYPWKSESMQLLELAIDNIEMRNFFIEEHSYAISYSIDKIVAFLESIDAYDLAEQLTAESEVCGD